MDVNSLTTNEMTLISALVAGLGILVGVVLNRMPKARSALEITNLRVEESETGGTLVTVFLKNKGQQVALISAIDARVRSVSPLFLNSPVMGVLSPSANYDILLDPSQGPRVVTLPTALQVPSGEADSFTVTLTGKSPEGGLEAVYLLGIELVYDRRRRACAETVGLVLPDSRNCELAYFAWQVEMERLHLESNPTSDPDMNSALIDYLSEPERNDIDERNRTLIHEAERCTQPEHRNQRLEKLIDMKDGYGPLPDVGALGQYDEGEVVNVRGPNVRVRFDDGEVDFPCYRVPMQARVPGTAVVALFTVIGSKKIPVTARPRRR